MSGFRATKVISDKGLIATVDCTREVNQRIAELEQQLAALRPDAERYRWLRDADNYPEGKGLDLLEDLTCKQFDAALDALKYQDKVVRITEGNTTGEPEMDKPYKGKDGLDRDIARMKYEAKLWRQRIKPHWDRWKKKPLDGKSFINLLVESGRVGVAFLYGHLVWMLVISQITTLGLLIWKWQ